MNKIIEELTDVNYNLCCNLKKYIFVLEILEEDMNMIIIKKLRKIPTISIRGKYYRTGQQSVL